MTTKTMRAIYENGVFRPLEAVTYQEGEKVELGILEAIGPDGKPIPVPVALRPDIQAIDSNGNRCGR
jgi:hypothetical protein